MILKSILLENIRSYSNQRMEFPTGSVLLAGDIGAGKSTILLAIEFALFGLKSGELSGGALLRHGAKQGSVEIIFEIEGKVIIVKRTLKKGKDRIGQGPGYVAVDNVREDLMPKEIKARVLELFNYPMGLVSKSQDLIYRYTVYTPQDQMKKIIYEDKDSRLDTLRKVFNIDKYKIIRENALIYSKSLRERRNNFEGRIVDLEDKKGKKKELIEREESLVSNSKKAAELLKNAKEKTLVGKSKLEKLELQVKEFNEMKKKIELLDLELKNVVEKREKDRNEIDDLQAAILKLRDELKDYKDESNLNVIYEDKERRVETAEKELVSVRNEKSEIKGKITHLKQSAEKIVNLDNCPLCQQKVPHEHKDGIVSKSNSEIMELKNKFLALEKKETELDSNLQFLKRELRELRERISLSKVLSVKRDGLLEKQEKLNLLKSGFEKSKENVALINSEKIELSKKLGAFAEIDERYVLVKKEYDIVLADERKLELECNSVLKELEVLREQIKTLSEEISEKEKVKKELKKIVELQSWIQNKFVNLVANMEKHVMLTVYHEFNELFQQWFDMLVEDESINVSLDDSFSVVVEQNGYETFIENLSGGEKTSVALAYRLALNRVINDVVSQIKTNDLLILDEPTEGFSTNQLDRVRDVLDQISIKQIIIVSHENKIESFVNNVVRVNKQEGFSSIG